MVGGFPKRASAPKPVEIEAPEVEFDEDGRRVITDPVVPAPRPPPTYARSLPPMPGPRPGALPPPPPAKPGPRVGALPPPPKAATPAPAAAKRPSPAAPYVRRPPTTRLDPNDVPLGSYSDHWGK
ncbi:hypothetical protein [Bradyrhizobium sp. CCBAU 45384]|uniref:hypothetical protein n=1 Tax=Bradyrhizobium sp. CCBAU 45384 TaxID=858428 RepID=UPI0023054CAD|nr:hypothetical protein [Bradyrhizobium sp. CCBAU 45384]MDA9411874.1 hypothetical protein [Bradyrhizobium sp. CCBAU 45384]